MSSDENRSGGQTNNDENKKDSPEGGAPQNPLPSWATRQHSATPFSEARMAAYFGPRWETTYRAKLSPFFEDPSFTVTWNWAAALGYPFWFLYRKLYMTFIMFFILSMTALTIMVGDLDKTALMTPDSPEARQWSIMTMAIGLSFTIAAGGTGNWFLFRRARAASMVVSMQQVPEDVAISRLQHLGGVSLKAVIAIGIGMIVAALMTAKAGTL